MTLLLLRMGVGVTDAIAPDTEPRLEQVAPADPVRLGGARVLGVDAPGLLPREGEGDGHDLRGGWSGRDRSPTFVRPGTSGDLGCQQVGLPTVPPGRPST